MRYKNEEQKWRAADDVFKIIYTNETLFFKSLGSNFTFNLPLELNHCSFFFGLEL